MRASNIKSGVNIFGVTGTYTGGDLKFYDYGFYGQDNGELDYDNDYIYIDLPSDFGKLAGLYCFGVWTNDGSHTTGTYTIAYPGCESNGTVYGGGIENCVSIGVVEYEEMSGYHQNISISYIGNRIRIGAPWDRYMLEARVDGATIVYIPG